MAEVTHEIAVFARAPVAGRAKLRLIPALGAVRSGSPATSVPGRWRPEHAPLIGSRGLPAPRLDPDAGCGMRDG